MKERMGGKQKEGTQRPRKKTDRKKEGRKLDFKNIMRNGNC